MNNEKYLKYISIFVGVALVISLIMNVTLISKVDELQFRMDQLSTTQHDIMNNVHTQTGQIESALAEFKEEQSWISPIQFNFNKENEEDGTTEAKFEWQIKELEEDSEVVFHYAFGDEEEFTDIPVEAIEQGLYQVTVPLKLDVEPQWDIFIRNETNHSEMMKPDIDEKEREKSKLRYYVTVSSDDMVKSNDIRWEYMDYFGASKYGIIQTDVDLMDDIYHVNVTYHGVDQSSIVVDEVYLLKYQGNNLIGEEEITIENGNHSIENEIRFFHLYEQEMYEDMRLVIKTVYSNGDSFEKEVYSE
ncbi:hypothetical protein [Ornithinibacillus halophilus]|uniref:Uncharacterized protein n=1 Tax=Ornithinibacillus halophilus TaxID=930117 RepID=A0A1M5N0T2_9BACI|nr:hypothetical protein [Ornithinibacillus halophilus]SHG82779.1 hypothetical protein SAMN05216225_106812 [Ornithinibacillus halophilus]